MPNLSAYYERSVESKGEELTIKFFIMKFEKLSDAKFASVQIEVSEMSKIKGGRIPACANAGKYHDTAEEICMKSGGGT